MQLKRLHIKNFRLIEDLTVAMDSQVAILGGNGCGKSSLLRAIERFFGQQTTIDADDFFGRDLSKRIEIGLTFHQFSDPEQALFDSRIHDNEMSVVRVFEAGGGRNNGAYYGSTLKHNAFDEIRNVEGAREKTRLYKDVKGSGEKYTTLSDIQRADQIPAELESWERANPSECQLGLDDGRFFGFTNVAKGALQKSTNFVFVPAVRDASADSLDAKGAVIARLMELVVRSAIQQRADIREFQTRVMAEFRSITHPDRLPELGNLSTALATTLQMFYNTAGVALEWRETADFEIPLPAADVYLDDDGFRGPVDRKGHGLQRAFILTLLQHLVRAAYRSADASVHEDESGSTEDSLPSLILAIEEPELYQHPTKQRHFARVLSSLSSAGIPGVAASTQVLFASHSALFVSLDKCHQIRIARRTSSTVPNLRTCAVRETTLDEIARKLEHAHASSVGSYTAEGLLSRLHTLGPELAEGFFADLVVLVEGVEDRAAILATAELAGIDLEANGISVLCVDGKHNLDRPAVIFRALGIPVFIIWDCDRNKDDDQIPANRALQRICEIAEEIQFDFATQVGANFACFEHNLTTTLGGELGEEAYLRLLDDQKKVFSVGKNKNALKVPAIVSALLTGAKNEGLESRTLSKILESISNLRKVGN